MSAPTKRGTKPTTDELVDAAERRELERLTRAAFLALDPDAVGVRAALVLASGIELLLMHLGCEDMSALFDGDMKRRKREMALTFFAKRIARLCRFAQTGRGAEHRGAADTFRRLVDKTAEALFLPVVLLPEEEQLSNDELLERWWSDPGPIDLTHPDWALKATMHFARARIFELEGHAPPMLPIRRPRDGERLYVVDAALEARVRA